MWPFLWSYWGVITPHDSFFSVFFLLLAKTISMSITQSQSKRALEKNRAEENGKVTEDMY